MRPAPSWSWPRAFVGLLSIALLSGCGWLWPRSADREANPPELAAAAAYKPAMLELLGTTAFERLKARETIGSDYERLRRSRCVAGSLISQLPGESGARRWEVLVFADARLHGYALPGARLGVHAGLLDALDEDSELAAALALLLVHAGDPELGRRLAQALDEDAALAAVQVYRGADGPQDSRLLYALLGLGPQVGMLLPASREQVTRLWPAALKLLADSGHDPQAMLRWQARLAASGQIAQGWPAVGRDVRSIAALLHERLPTAQERYESARQQGRRPDCRP